MGARLRRAPAGSYSHAEDRTGVREVGPANEAPDSSSNPSHSQPAMPPSIFFTPRLSRARRTAALRAPLQCWLMHQRVVAAQRRLARTAESIDEVAEAVGLESAATLRVHFARALGISPAAYRRRFSTASGR